MTMIQNARRFAIEAHKDTRYGDLPYEFHLQAVVDVMGECTPEAIAAAWLHDVVEDTHVSLNDIRNNYGGKVARLVDCVTDAPGNNRREKKVGMYAKLSSGPPLARRLKMADRIANMTASMENPKMRAMYRAEFPEFIQIAGVDPTNDDLTVRCYRLFMLALRQ
jgi:(p)ppGpp synthase/HD superfamily hydrolase